MLLLVAATETSLLAQLEQALPPPLAPACLPQASSAEVCRHLLLTLLFLGAVGLQRTWDLRGYTADGLALLTGRMRAYGYRYTEAFLSQVARADGAERFTDALAGWTTQLWQPYVNGLTKHRLVCPMGVSSRSLFVPPVAFLLRRRKPKYRESL